MINTALLGLASRFAPNLVRRFAGDTAGDVVEGLLGIGHRLTGSRDPEEIAARLEQEVALAHEFRQQAASLDVQLEEAYLKDRQNARSREIQLAQMGITDRLMLLVGAIVVLGFVGVIVAIVFMPELPDSKENLLYALTGTLGAAFMAVVGYYFGSSRGSSEKTRMMSGGANGGTS